MIELFILDGSGIPENQIKPELVLSAEELRTYDKFRAESRRRDFLLGRLLLKLALKARTGHSAREFPAISTTHSPTGKPLVSGAQFSLSHDNGVILLAIGDQPMGVDIETVQHFDEAMVRTCFSEYEQRRIANAPRPDRMATVLWCFKEAAVKVTGRGLLSELGRTTDGEFFQCGGLLNIAGRDCAWALCSTLPIAPVSITPIEDWIDGFLDEWMIGEPLATVQIELIRCTAHS